MNRIDVFEADKLTKIEKDLEEVRHGETLESLGLSSTRLVHLMIMTQSCMVEYRMVQPSWTAVEPTP